MDELDEWLSGNQQEAQGLLRLAPVEHFDARPLPKQPQ
jgi:hypothetical protein